MSTYPGRSGSWSVGAGPGHADPHGSWLHDHYETELGQLSSTADSRWTPLARLTYGLLVLRLVDR